MIVGCPIGRRSRSHSLANLPDKTGNKATAARRGSIPFLNKPNENFWVPTRFGTEEPRPTEVRDASDQDSPPQSELEACDRVDGGSDQFLTYPFHPLANVFPLLEGCEFSVLVKDIRTHGLNEPIVLLDGLVLDGRNRMRACVAAGVPYRTVSFDGPDPVAFVISANLRRRHLNTSQRSMVAAELANMRQRARTDLAPNGAMSQGNAAKLLNVGRRSVQRALALRESADPAIIKKVMSGKMTVAAAAALVKLASVSEAKTDANGAREVRAAARQTSASHDAEPQMARIEKNTGLRPGKPARHTAIDAGPSDVLADIKPECDVNEARLRNKRFRLIPPTKAEEFAEWIDELTDDERSRALEWLRDCKPRDVIKASRQGPML